ncbi:MAG: hypothetical protein V4737_10665, partial [Curtobacterium sp.]
MRHDVLDDRVDAPARDGGQLVRSGTAVERGATCCSVGVPDAVELGGEHVGEQGPGRDRVR